MSNNLAARVREVADVDPRVAHSKSALSRAIIALVQERDLREVTVQDILDRAGVGRATFYAHYRNKEDVLHSSYDGAFAAFASMLEHAPAGRRLFPVKEFLQHLDQQRPLVTALQRSAQIDEVWALLVGHAARAIHRQLTRESDSVSAGISTGVSTVPVAAVAHMLAGALAESIRWWLDHPASATAEAMDDAFHEMARGAMRRAG